MLYLDLNVNEICSWRFGQYYSIRGLGNGLTPIKRQAIIGTNNSLVYWRIHACLGFDELTHWDQTSIPLAVFRSNSKFDKNSQCSGLKLVLPITTAYRTRNDSNTIVTCAKCRCDGLYRLWTRALQISLNYEFDRIIVSGTGARTQRPPCKRWYVLLNVLNENYYILI